MKKYLTPRPIYVIKHGDVVSVEVSRKPGFWEENWYKIITATAVVVGIYATVRK